MCAAETTKIFVKDRIWYVDEHGVIRSAVDDKAIQSRVNNRDIEMQPFDGRPEQQWRIQGKKVANGIGDCLDINCASDKDGAEVIAYPYIGKKHQHWEARYAHRYEFFIVSELNGKVLDIDDATPCAAGEVFMFPRKNLPARSQLWYLDEKGFIRSALNDFALHCDASGHDIKLKKFTSAKEQQWRFKGRKVVNGFGNCLDINYALKNDGAKVIGYRHVGGKHQHWRPEYTQRRDYFIVSELNGKVLDIDESNPCRGAKVVVYTKKDPPAKSQLWYEDGLGVIRSALNDFVLHSNVNYQSIEMKSFTDAPEQQWHFKGKKVFNGCGECLDINYGSIREGAELIAYPYFRCTHQRWRAEDAKDAKDTGRNLFVIISDLNGKVLDIEKANPNPGAKVVMNTRKNPPPKSQLWYLDEQNIIRSALNELVLHSNSTSSKGKYSKDEFLEHVEQEVKRGKAYRCQSSPRGRAVIINNEYFIGMENRPGSEKDRENLRTLFTLLDFETVVHSNHTAKEITDILRKESKEECHRKYDMFVLFLLSHGIQGKVYGIDGKAVDIATLVSLFDGNNCPNLIGKPKLIFIQACQGDLKEVGLPVNSSDKNQAESSGVKQADSSGKNQADSSDRTVSNKPVSWYIKGKEAVIVTEKLKEEENLDLCVPLKPLPIVQSDAMSINATIENSATDEVQNRVSNPPNPQPTVHGRIAAKADIAIFYATAAGYVAWRRIDRGSFFVQCLIYVLGKRAHCDDFMSIAAEVLYALLNYEALPGEQHNYIQLGETRNTLIKKVYLLPHNKLYNI